MSREWRFSQCFGETSPVEQTEPADILSAVEFDQTGRFLATGDKGGRIVIFEADAGGGDRQDRIRNGTSTTTASSSTTATASSAGSADGAGAGAGAGAGTGAGAAPSAGRRRTRTSSHEYRFYCEFQSHEPEFDYLKSLEIEEKINQIRWCPPTGGAMFLLSTNDKTIIQWKIADKQVREVQHLNMRPETAAAAEDAARGAVEPNIMGMHSLSGLALKSRRAHAAAFKAATQAGMPAFKSAAQLVVPRLHAQRSLIACTPRRTFGNAHTYHINSISVNSDGETFLSADDLRVNLWNLGVPGSAFTIVDIKPDNMEDLTEVITACEFHPSHCSTFAYSNSRGAIKLCDMRRNALCDSQAKVFEEEEQPGDKSFFSEIIASISDIKFTRDGRYIVARDYLTLKIWDVKMETRPVKTIQIHEHLRSKLCDLYENDCIFDKFECIVSPDGKYFASGSYHNYVHIFDRTGRDDVVIEATNGPAGRKAFAANGSSKRAVVTDAAQIDFAKKPMNLAWHPDAPVIAVAASNNLFLYSATKAASGGGGGGGGGWA